MQLCKIVNIRLLLSDLLYFFLCLEAYGSVNTLLEESRSLKIKAKKTEILFSNMLRIQLMMLYMEEHHENN